MRCSAGAIGGLVDPAAQVCERLDPVGRWILHDTAGLEAEDLRDPRADEIGDDDKAGIVKSADEELDSREVGDRFPVAMAAFRPPASRI